MNLAIDTIILSTYYCTGFFAKPITIYDSIAKSNKQLETHKGIHNNFITLFSILRDALPNIGSFSIVINLILEYPKLHITKGSIFSSLVSTRLIIKCILSYYKDN